MQNMVERVLAKTHPNPDGCLIWTGTVSKAHFTEERRPERPQPIIRRVSEQPQIWVGTRRTNPARILYAHAHGLALDDVPQLRCGCQTPLCIAPEHRTPGHRVTKAYNVKEPLAPAQVPRITTFWLWLLTMKVIPQEVIDAALATFPFEAAPAQLDGVELWDGMTIRNACVESRSRVTEDDLRKFIAEIGEDFDLYPSQENAP